MITSPHKPLIIPLGILASIALSSAVALGADDPFAPFLSSVPTVRQALGQTDSGAGAAAITTKKFTFGSRNGINTVYAVEAFPQQAGIYPAILFLHGGGGNADGLVPLIQGFAQAGYVTLAIDQPGICGTANTPNTLGPWKPRAAGGETPRFEVASGAQNSTLFDAEVAVLEGFNWLRSQANVDAKAIGVTGFSWGGYSTTMISGLLGDEIKASYAVFGCGFYDKGSFWSGLIAGLAPATRNIWLTYLDAGRRAPGMRAAYFIESETNDTFYWPEAVGATLDAIPGQKNHVWGPNLNHMQLPSGTMMQHLHFDYYLKGKGSPFIDTRVSAIVTGQDASKRVTIELNVPSGVSVASAQLYYSEQKPDWQTRAWIAIAAQAEAPTRYTATIPPDIARKKINFYAFVTDDRSVSTSSAMYDSSSAVVFGGAGADAGVPGVPDAAAPADAGGDGAAPSDATIDAPPGGSVTADASIADAANRSDAGSPPESPSNPPSDDAAGGRGGVNGGSGCACRAAPASASSDWMIFFALVSFAVAVRRRRRVADRRDESV